MHHYLPKDLLQTVTERGNNNEGRPRHYFWRGLMSQTHLFGIKIKPLGPKEITAMGNWLLIADRVYQKDIQVEDIVQMLAHEMAHKKRKYIMTRLRARYNRIMARETNLAFEEDFGE